MSVLLRGRAASAITGQVPCRTCLEAAQHPATPLTSRRYRASRYYRTTAGGTSSVFSLLVNMTLTLVTPDAGLQAAALRAHRGDHASNPTGECARLAKLVPHSIVVPNAAAPMPLAAAEVPFRFALWLVSGLLVLAPDAKDALYFQYVPGIERIGAALDRALSGITGDLPRSASVLRKQLSQVARRHIAAGVGAAYVVALADLYEVADDFPTGQNVDNYYDWIGVVTLGMLTDAAGRLGIAYGSLEQCMGLRFDSDAAVAVRGRRRSRPWCKTACQGCRWR